MQKYEVPTTNSTINSGIKLPSVKPTTPAKMSVSMPPKSNMQSMSKSPISAAAPLIKMENETKAAASVTSQSPAGGTQVKLVRSTLNNAQGTTGTSPGVSLVRFQNNQALGKSTSAASITVTRSTSKPQQIVMVMSPSANKGELGKMAFTTTQTVTLAQGQKTYTAAELNQIIQLSQQGTALKIVSMANQASSPGDKPTPTQAEVKLVQPVRQANGQVIIQMVSSSQSTTTTTVTTGSPSSTVQSKILDTSKGIKVEQSDAKSVPDSSTTPIVSTTSASTTVTSSTQVTPVASASSANVSSSTTPAVPTPAVSTATTTKSSVSETMTKCSEVTSNPTASSSTMTTTVTSTSTSTSSLQGTDSASASETPDSNSKVSSTTTAAMITPTSTPITSSGASTATSSSIPDSSSKPTVEQSTKTVDTPDSSTTCPNPTSKQQTTSITTLSTKTSAVTSPSPKTTTSVTNAAPVTTSSITRNSDLQKIAALAAASTKLQSPATVVSRPVTCGDSTSQQSTAPTTTTPARDMGPPAPAVNAANKIKPTVRTVWCLFTIVVLI